MSIRKLRAGRVSTVSQDEYIGEKGSIFWNELTGEFRLSDGETPGGTRVGFPVATPDLIGGMKLGPGVTLNGQQQLIIDTAGLDFSFGDFYAFTNTGPSDGACLSSVNANQDVNLVSNGTGVINVVGEFHVHKTDSTVEDALASNPVFSIKGDGQVNVYVTEQDANAGALSIIGSSTGNIIAPGLPGAMLHITGQITDPNRLYFDGNANYVAINGRRWNNSVATPTQVKANEDILRINATAATDAGLSNVAIAQIRYYALEDQTTTAQGGAIDFVLAPLGQPASARVVAATVKSTGISALRFTGPLTGNVTGKADTAGNADTVTNGVYTTGSYSDPTWLTISKSKVGLGNVENTALSTSTHYIGTTSIQYNRASASQTLTGVSIDGNAGTVTNGVYTTGSYSDPSWLTISKTKVGLGNVENTALSTWSGTTNITTVGTLTNLIVSGTIRYNIAESANGVQPATPTNVKTNSVTANGRSGTITTNSGALANGATATFTVNNTSVSANDVIILNIQSGATADTYNFMVMGVRTNAFDIQLRNFTNSSRSDTIVFNYAVIKVS